MRKDLKGKMKNIAYNFCYQKKKGDFLLLIGSYKSSKYFRIYQKIRGLEFESGIKKKGKKLQSFRFSNQSIAISVAIIINICEIT